MSIQLSYHEYGLIKFVYCNNDGLRIEMDISEPYIVSREAWLNFASKVANNQKALLRFCSCNNDVALGYQNGNITYGVSTGGHGGDGGIDVSFSKEKYGDTFIRLFNEIAKSDVWERADDE